MKIHVKPAPNLRVKNPATGQALPPEGAEVEHSTYWRRALAAGDVTLVKDKAKTPAPTPRGGQEK